MEDRLASKNIRLCDEAKQQNRTMSKSKCKTELHYDYLIIIDFECTCDVNSYSNYEHEIIEFPAVLIDVREKRVKDTFRTVVKPTKNPKLSKYCSELTGINQDEVDQAPSFPEALNLFRKWSKGHGIETDLDKRYAFVTDGPWDIAKFLQMQCIICSQPLKVVMYHDFRMYVNLRRVFVNRYCKEKDGRTKPNMPHPNIRSMLKHLKLQFSGREHCGLDDCLNMAKIVIKMLGDNSELRVNEKLVLETKIRKWQKQVFNSSDTMPNGEEVKAEWMQKLPYKVIVINRAQFLKGKYKDCESCDSNYESS